MQCNIIFALIKTIKICISLVIIFYLYVRITTPENTFVNNRHFDLNLKFLANFYPYMYISHCVSQKNSVQQEEDSLYQ
jgi:hypothetical protein